MPRRSLKATVAHLKHLEGEATIDARYVLSPATAPTAAHRRLAERVRRDLTVPPRVREVRTLRNQGLTIKGIARQQEVSEQTVRNRVRQRSLGRPPVTQAQALRRQGHSVDEIAQGLGMTLRTVRGWLRRPLASRAVESFAGMAYIRREQGSLIPVVALRLVCTLCEEESLGVALADVSLVGAQGQGYCRSCKRQRDLQVIEQRAVPFETAGKWLETRDMHILAEAFLVPRGRSRIGGEASPPGVSWDAIALQWGEARLTRQQALSLARRIAGEAPYLRVFALRRKGAKYALLAEFTSQGTPDAYGRPDLEIGSARQWNEYRREVEQNDGKSTLHSYFMRDLP